MQINETPVNVLIPNYSSSVFNDEYENNLSLSTHQIINQEKELEANLANAKVSLFSLMDLFCNHFIQHIIKSNHINKDELRSKLSNLLYNIEKHIQVRCQICL
jgi:hypothetical protein